MATLKSPTVDTSGATKPDSPMAVIDVDPDLAKAGLPVYTGGILASPTSTQLTADPAVGYATSG